MRNGHGRRRALGPPPPEAGARMKLFDQEFKFRESHTVAETKETPDRIPEKKNDSIYICLFFFHARIHLKLYTSFTTPPAEVFTVIWSRKTMVLSLYQVDVQTKHAQNDEHFNSTKRNIIKI